MESTAEVPSEILPKKLLKGILRFINPDDYMLFSVVVKDTHGDLISRGDTDISSDHKAALITLECEDFGERWDASVMRARIETLTSLNASLEKHLTERTQERYNELMEASLSVTCVSRVQYLKNELIPNLRNRFNDCMRSSLYNGLSMAQLSKRLTELHSFLHILSQLKRICGYREIIRRHELGAKNRVIAAAYAVNFIEAFIHTERDASRMNIFQTLKENFTNRLRHLMKLALVKIETNSTIYDSLSLLGLFGLGSMDTAKMIIEILRKHLEAIVLTVFHRYTSLESSKGIFSSFENSNPSESLPSQKNLAMSIRLLGPDVILLVVCRVLSEFTVFFERTVKDLSFKREDCDYCDATIPDEIKAVVKVIYDVEEQKYFSSVVAFINSDFDNLRAAAIELLVRTLEAVNLAAVKDRNDLLKIALLLRFFLVSQKDGFQRLVTHNALDGTPDDKLEEYDVNFDIRNIKSTLRKNGEIVLENHSFMPKLDFEEQVIRLERAISSKVLTHYMEHSYLEALEKLSIAFSTGSLQRLPLYGGFKYSTLNLYEILESFSNRIAEGQFVKGGGLRLSTINPYNGWTPSAGFMGYNIESFPDKSSFKEHKLERDKPLEVATDLLKNFGGVCTLPSRVVWAQFDNFWRAMVVQPDFATLHLRKFLSLVDTFILHNFGLCNLPASNLEDFENLKSFAAVTNTKIIGRGVLGSNCLSQMAIRINAIESSFTVLELLNCRLSINCDNCRRLIDDYYTLRTQIIRELRMATYPISMFNLLQKKLPGDRITRVIQSCSRIPFDAAKNEIDRLFESFKLHVSNVKEFIEASDCGSVPILIKIILWKYGVHITQGCFRPVFMALCEGSAPERLLEIVNKQYESTIELVDGIRQNYEKAVLHDLTHHNGDIVQIDVYRTVIRELYST